MGNSTLVLPPMEFRTKEICCQYGMEEIHFKKLWGKFVEMDVEYNGFWTMAEIYRLIREPSTSMVTPIVEHWFHFADRGNDGVMGLDDFLTAGCSLCALSREEILQFLFMIIDKDRTGYITKQELLEFFDFRGPDDDTPVFPLNNSNALELYRRGDWKEIFFDEFADMCELFPYIPFPCCYFQNMLRSHLLGMTFWRQWDDKRLNAFYYEAESRGEKTFKIIDGEKIRVRMPSRFSMKEILEFTRRKASSAKGEIQPQQQPSAASMTKERDMEMARMPLLNIIRNPTCKYHVPYVPGLDENSDQEEEEDDYDNEIDLDSGSEDEDYEDD
jgi:Ca2+-binding EF-hand superfamily protein